MKKYNVCIGAYVRAYAQFEIMAADDEAATMAAIEHYRRSGDIEFSDEDYNNTALPSIVDIQDDSGNEITGAIDFSSSDEDAREYASRAMLNALKKAEGFIGGFEGDEIQEGIDELIAEVRAAIKAATYDPAAPIVAGQ